MDSNVEKQFLEQLKAGDLNKFLPLFDEVFGDVYRYVFRRVFDQRAAGDLVRTIFVDALAKVEENGFEAGFRVWMFAVARERVWKYLERNGFPKSQGVLMKADFENVPHNKILVENFAKMMAKLSLEEKEIVRLKFFEELADFELAYVLNEDNVAISGKVLRVIKRVHLLFFGPSNGQGAYFAEISGEMAKIRAMELIEVPEFVKLDLSTELSNRIMRRDFAIDVESEVEESYADATGSDDPAKIFVQAVKEMREEEAKAMEREEAWLGFFERWKRVLLFVPVAVFVLFLGISAYKLWFEGGVVRGYPTACVAEVDFDGDFNDSEKRGVNRQISDGVCEAFEVEKLAFKRESQREVNLEVAISGGLLKYTFARPKAAWKVMYYERVTDRN